jgi:hypothetical protein
MSWFQYCEQFIDYGNQQAGSRWQLCCTAWPGSQRELL